MMKRLIFATVALAAMTACNTTPNSGEYKIEGINRDVLLNNTPVYLREVGAQTALDTTTITNGSFTFEGKHPYATILEVTDGDRSNVQVVTENGTVKVAIGGAKGEVLQGEESKKLLAIDDSVSNMSSRFYQFAQMNQMDQELVNAKYAEYMSSINQYIDQTLMENNGSIVGAYCVARKASTMESLAQIDSLIALAPLSKNLPPVIRRREALVNAERTAAGKMFTDIKGSDVAGNPAALSDYVGKGNYVLVDFWASWCGPCRREIPNLRSVYNKHKESGLVLLGVNVWDKEPAFKEAIEKEEMTWSHIYASHNTEATDTYGISGIPCIILFAPDGTIVNRTIRGEEIMKLVDSLY